MSGLTISDPLTPDEKAELGECESIIQNSLYEFRQAADAIERIRDKRLYRQFYSSFDAYMEFKWKPIFGFMSRSYVSRMITANEVIKDIENQNCFQLETSLPVSLPENTAQAYALKDVPAPQRAEEWNRISEKAKEEGAKPTAAYIRSNLSQAPSPRQAAPAPEMTQEQKSRLGEEKQTFDGIEGYKNRTPAKSGRGYVEPTTLRWDGQRLWYVHIQPRMAPHKPLRTPCSIAGHHLSAIGMVLPELPQTHPLNKEHTEDPYDFYADEEQGRQNYENNQPQKTEEEIVREYERRRREANR